jgi:hypothetical protein
MKCQSLVSAFRRTSRTVAIALALLLMPAIVSAQTSKRRTELGGDLRWLAGIHFEDVNANETAFGGVTRTVFRSATSFDQVACPEVKVIVGLTRALDFEGALAYGRTHLTTRITQDPEASNVTIAEPISAYVLEAGVAAHLARWRGRRSAPFVSAGAGYLRQIHDGQTHIEDGPSGYVGGGLRIPLSDDTARGLKSAALRLELRATILGGGSTLDGSRHILPSVIGGVFFHL